MSHPAPAFPTLSGLFSGEAYCTSGTSPTRIPTELTRPDAVTAIHLVGPGQVGQAFLGLLPQTPFRLVGITDSTATLHHRGGLDPLALAAHKAAGGKLADLSGAESLPVDLAIDLVDADLVVDATPSGRDPHGATRRNLRLLRHGKGLALAAKDTLCHGAADLLAEDHHGRVGIDAVLGGTGAALLRDLEELRRDCEAIALVGNASTTAVVEAVEAGASIEEGIRRAQEAGVLEPDPELDLSGADAVTKVVAVASALWQRPLRIEDVPCQHLRSLDVGELRRRFAAGQTTRLVGRARPGATPRVAFEAIDRRSPLAVPSTHVAYLYRLAGGESRIHTGHGIGPDRTAAALFRDLRVLAAGAFATTGGIRRGGRS